MRRHPLLALTVALTASSVGAAAYAQGTPRLTAPMPTARVTSQRPTLHWLGGDGDVDICRDRACGTVVVTFPGHGGATAPGQDLPAGNVFWRVRVGSATSPVWQFTVPPHAAAANAADTSWGSSLDANGDGFADVLVPGANGAGVFMGSGSGVAGTAATTIQSPHGAAGFAWSAGSAGDVNGDGYVDAVVGTFSSNKAYVFLGGASGLSTTPATTLSGPNDSDFGSTVASAGDVDGDGYADVIVGAPKANAAYLFLGSASGLSSSPAATMHGPDRSHRFGFVVASAGDINGDGRGDVAVGSLDNAVHVFVSGASGLSAQPTASINVPAPLFGASLGAADVNGDGRSDLVVGAAGTSAVFVYAGGAEGIANTALSRLQGAANSGFGFTLAGVGDVNHDGFGDVLVGTGSPPVILHPGGAQGLAEAATVTLAAADVGEYGAVATFAGDVNGDGFPDAVVIGRRNGTAQVFLGSDGGLTANPAATLHGPTAAVTAHAAAPVNVPDTDDR